MSDERSANHACIIIIISYNTPRYLGSKERVCVAPSADGRSGGDDVTHEPGTAVGRHEVQG